MNIDSSIIFDKTKIEADVECLFKEDPNSFDINKNYNNFYNTMLSSIHDKKKEKKKENEAKKYTKFSEISVQTNPLPKVTNPKTIFRASGEPFIKSTENSLNLQIQEIHAANTENLFLSGQMESIKNKLNSFQKKNNDIKNLLESSNQVTNVKLLDKIINSFIENVVVNWNEVTDLLIDEMIYEEVL